MPAAVHWRGLPAGAGLSAAATAAAVHRDADDHDHDHSLPAAVPAARDDDSHDRDDADVQSVPTDVYDACVCTAKPLCAMPFDAIVEVGGASVEPYRYTRVVRNCDAVDLVRCTSHR